MIINWMLHHRTKSKVLDTVVHVFGDKNCLWHNTSN